MVPFMIVAIKKQKEKQMLSAAILLLAASLLLLWYLPLGFWTLVLLVVMFFTAFNYLEATMPSILSRIAPAGVKGSVMGIYSSSQFLGAFTGGIIGGIIASQFGEQAIFLVMSLITLLWFFGAISMKPLQKSKSYTFTTSIDCQEKANEVAEKLIELPGVIEAILVQEESVVYLKVDDKVVNLADIKAALNP
jgi:MFS family permease